jgi:zinc protease
VKLRAEFYSNLESGMGAHMPRFGLMHYLACFTLFDGDPQRINSVLAGFEAVTPAQVQAAAKKYLVPQNRAVLVRQPVAKAAA